jgi:TRAP-type uncharacterized transport system substrate-binding protein
MRDIATRFFCLVVVGLFPDFLSAQTAPEPPQLPAQIEHAHKAKVNEWTIGLAGGLLEGTLIRYAADIAKVLDDGENLRVIPMVTYGAVNNVNDLLNLRGIDIALTQADVLDHFRRQLKVPDIDKKIQYITPLFRSEAHILAREEFHSLKDLEGRKVSFGLPGMAANLTGQIIFRRLNINIEPIFIDNAAAVEKMRSGEIAAVVQVVGKPNALFAAIKPQGGLHFLPVEYDAAFEDYYVPTSLNANDYPALIRPSDEIPTIAVQTILAVYNWPTNSDRYRRVARFIEAFFTKYDQLTKPPYQPKWKEVNLTGKVTGWTRYRVAEEVLAKLGPTAFAAGRQEFQRFLNETKPAANTDRDRLFEEFIKWRGARQ